MYIEKYWILPSILLLCFCSTYVSLFNRVCTSLVFLLVSGTIKIIRTEWIGINVNLKMYSFDHLRMYNIDHINTCCSRR